MARKKLQKVFALLLTASMTMSLLSVGALAAKEDDPITLISLEVKEDTMSVDFGTSKEEVLRQLPEMVTGYYQAEEEEKPVEETLAVTEGQDGDTVPEDQDGDTVPEDQNGNAVPEDQNGSTGTENQNGEVQDAGTLTENYADPAPTENLAEVQVPVSWSCEDGYHGWKVRTYTFRAQLAENSGFDYTGEMPAVKVTVQEDPDHEWVATTTDYYKSYAVCWECGSARGDGWFYDAETETMYFSENITPGTLNAADIMTYPWYRLPKAGDPGKFVFGLGEGDTVGMIRHVVLEENVTKVHDGLLHYMEDWLETVTIEGDLEVDPMLNVRLFGGSSDHLQTLTIAGNLDFDMLNVIFTEVSADTVIFDNEDLELALKTNNGGFISGITLPAENLIIRNAKSIGGYCFTYNNHLTNVTLGNIRSWDGQCAFYNCPNLTTLTLDGTTSIGEYAFQNCTGLTSVTIPKSCTYVAAGAFKGCTGITELNIPATTQLGYSDIFVNFPNLVERMENILAGKFTLNETQSLTALTVPGGWESSRVGTDNATGTNDTQVTKAAKWTDGDKTEAEVEFQFNYDKQQGMDFLFVVDYSGSMAEVGNLEADSDSRFTSMQSKLLDVADELLNTPAYDNRVAFVTFSTNASYLHTLGFTKEYAETEEFVLDYSPYGSTNYAIALDKAYQLIDGRTDTSREAAVIFISDGQPNKFYQSSGNETALLQEIKTYADKIKGIQQFGHDTKIFGVMQSVPNSEMDRCVKAMQSVCTEGLFFMASDTEEFSQAVNNAIGAAYNIYTLTDTIDPAFTLDESSITVSAGTYVVDEDDNGNTTITWTITGVPYVTHTMSYRLDLNPVGGSYPYGSFDTNEGAAAVALSTEQVNAVATPVLTRTEEMEPVEWDLSKSKEATELDANFESNVTLSLPAAGYKGDLDVVFVIDGSTSTDEDELAAAAASLLEVLSTYENLNVKASVVIYGGSEPVLYTSGELLLLSADNVTKLTDEITDDSYDGREGRSGSNLQAGVETARAILDADTAVDAADKYLIILSDGGARMWYNSETGSAMAKCYGGTDSNYFNTNQDFQDRYVDGTQELRSFEEVRAGSVEDITRYAVNFKDLDTNTIKVEGVQDENYYTNLEMSTYFAASSIIAASAESQVIWVDYPYSSGKYTEYTDSFKIWLEDQGYVTRYDSDAGATAVFSTVKNDLIQLVDKGSYVVDVIGKGVDDHGNDYDFAFINDIDRLTLTVNGVEQSKTQINDTSYGFGSDGQGGYAFEVTYYADGTVIGGKTYDECFVWEINVPVTKDAPVQLTYAVKLTNPQTSAGTYGQYDRFGENHEEALYTNVSATLFPVDSEGNPGDSEDFEKPTVEYTVKGGGGGGSTGGGGGTDPEPKPDPDPGTDIPDENTPTTDLPDPETPTTDLPEEDVPMAEVPKTGDMTTLWLALSALSGTGLAGVTFLGRKKQEEV